MNEKIIKDGTAKLRPRARIIRTIGEELISNDIVAIIELIKNSYDADSRKVDITFDEEVGGSITIKDYGNGMTLSRVKNGWMEPATIVKKINRKSEKKRKMLGEKGIGRFAAARLSKKLHMYTKTETGNEICATFYWEHFKNDNKYLDEIECNWKVREPQVIGKKGTTLVLSDLYSEWSRKKIEELKRALSRLVNPFKIKKGFKIFLYLPETLKDLAGEVIPPESLGKPHYSIKGIVDVKGKAKFEYHCRKNNETENKEVHIRLNKSHEYCAGPFGFEFRVWDRENESLRELADELNSTLRAIKRDLNDAAGISIYRDKFRVLPYGESKDDWLRLDLRRVNNPTLRLSNNQIIGYISIDLEKNPLLVDQSNREGIVESESFDDLKQAILYVLNELETRRYDVRPRHENADSNTLGIFEKFSLKSLVELINNKIPDDKETKEAIKETSKSIDQGVKEIKDVLARYRRLSTLGLLLDVVLHDGNNVLLVMDNEIELLQKEFRKETISEEKVIKHSKNIQHEKTILAELFKRLEPFGGRRRGQPREIILEESIKNIFDILQNKISEQKVAVDIPQGSTKIKFAESELELIFVNLVNNSLYWLEHHKTANKQIKIVINNTEDALEIIFSDNGPGVEQKYIDRIFEPYFSRKPDGIGLGLTTTGEIVTENNGVLELIDNGPLNGASFRIAFRR